MSCFSPVAVINSYSIYQVVIRGFEVIEMIHMC